MTIDAEHAAHKPPSDSSIIQSVLRAEIVRLRAIDADLLAALKDVLLAFEDDGDHRGRPELDCVARARAAIARAEGRDV